MKRFKKIILISVGSVVVLVVVAVVVAVMFLNSIAKRGIVQGGTYALGVPVALNDIDIGILGGSVSLDTLKVGNPQGYDSDHFMTLGKGKVSVKLTSLMSDTVRVPELTLDTLDLQLQKKNGKANYDVIMDHLAQLSSKDPKAKPEPAKEGTSKKLIITELTIRNVNVHADLVGGPGVIGSATTVDVPITEIKLKNVGQTGDGVAGSGVTIGELSGLVLEAVISAAIAKGGLPADMVNDLKGQLGKLGDLAGGVGKEVATQAQAATEVIGKQAGEIGKEVGKQAEKLGEGLKGILPGGGK